MSSLDQGCYAGLLHAKRYFILTNDTLFFVISSCKYKKYKLKADYTDAIIYTRVGPTFDK